MKTCRLIIAFLLTLPGFLRAQNNIPAPTPANSCGQQQMTDRLFNSNPALKQFQQQAEVLLREYDRKMAAGEIRRTDANAVVTLPVVVHIIHNNGPENISDAQVFTAIQHLNEAFANTGYYDPADGVNTQIQFCLAQRDPSNNPTNGINRVVSPLTVVDGFNNSSQDQALKNLSRWNPRCYINIWLVKEIAGSVAGYAYLPSAHGMNIDGIVGEAAYFGSSYPNDVLIIHEMGHYLGLYHTFQGGCTNTDCSKDGDQVCDTPPDQSTAGIACNSTANSCSTDALSGFSTDVNDLHTDYLDYGNWNCMKVFTQGQANRMNWFIQNVRKSLLECKSCMPPCPNPITANFSSSSGSVSIGSTVNFTNSSSNASTYRWYINRVFQSASGNFSYTFNTAGTYIIQLSAFSSSPLCDSAVAYDTVVVSCPVSSGFSPTIGPFTLGQTVTFTNSSAGATSYQWLVNGSVASASANFTYTFSSPGFYSIALIGTNGLCNDTSAAIFSITDTVPGTVDTCERSFFQKTYSISDRLEVLSMDPVTDGGTIVCGVIRRVAFPQTDAMAMKLGANGKVMWTVSFRNFFLSSFAKIRETRDGGFIAVGIADNLDNDPQYLFLVRLNAAGNVIWNQHYAPESGAVFPEDVIELEDGSFAISASNSIAVNNQTGLMLVVGTTGNVIWGRQYRHQNETFFHNAVQSGDTLIVAGTTSDETRYSGTVISMNKNNGNIYSSISFRVPARGNFKNFIFKTGYGYFISTAEMNMGDLSTKQNGVLSLNHKLDIIHYYRKEQTDESFTSISAPVQDSGYSIPGTHTDGLLLMTAGNGIQYFWGNRYGAGLGPVQPINTLVLSNGQYMTGGNYSNAFNRTSFMLVKTDRLGNTPECPGNPPTQSTIIQQMNSAPLQWQQITPFIERTKRPLNFFTERFLVEEKTLCLFCDTTVDIPDTCRNASFQEIIKGPGEDVASDIKVLNDGSYLIAGYTTSTVGGLTQIPSALFMKISPKGNITWQKKISGAAKNVFSKIVITSSGTQVMFGTTHSQHNTNGSMIIAWGDGSGNIAWAREHDFRNASYTGFNAVDDVIELPNGDFAFCATATGINTDVGQPMSALFNIVGVLTPDGSIRWVRRFREYYTESGGSSLAITHLNNWLFVSTTYGIMKLTLTDGTPTGLNKKFFSLGGFKTLEVSGANILASDGITRTLFDQNLQVLSSWRVYNPDNNYSLGIAGTGAANASSSQGGIMKAPARSERNLFLAKFPQINTVQWSYKYPYPAGANVRSLTHTRSTSDKGFVSAGSAYVEITDSRNSPNDILLLRTDSAGNINDCPRATVPLNVLPFTDFSFLELHARTYPITTASYQLNLQPEDANLTVEPLCTNQQCNLLSMIGSDTVCRLSDTLRLTVTRNRDCDAFTDWIVDSSIARIVSANDSVLTLLFKTKGRFKIRARILGGCKIIEDSTWVTVFNSPDSLYLGPDIELCKISTYTLKAGAGFRSYTWQDGSTDSTLTIFTPGLYHVTVEDDCGNVYRDSVHVTQAPDLPFDLGPDRKICVNDTLTIKAPPGFLKYYWSPLYNISNAYTDSIKVSPRSDTTYIVVAEKSAGCVVTDSIRITVNSPLPVYIGADTSICVKDTLTINATTGFSSYQWNTGSISSSIRAFAKGWYSVRATDNNGCVATDSLEIKNVFSLPAVNLGNDFSICNNQVHEFDAGDFSSYLWQDGSINRRFITGTTGNYWVRVTDNNDCYNADTVTIIAYLNSPADFLDKEAEICIGQRLEIKAATGYSKYRWFNNAGGSSIVITAPGSYWLEVTNSEGCTVRDTILVKAKDCLKGLFFPNAFTPHNGGANNYFRPSVHGILESFHMIVFNRYGQKVFETKDPQVGWDGRLNGHKQSTGTYTWSATYKFAGDALPKNEKGVVVLVH